MAGLTQVGAIIVVLALLWKPLGDYMARVFTSETHWRVEAVFYRVFRVDAHGRSALRAAADAHPDVVVLDLGLPDMDGTEVIAGLRGWTRMPIMVLTARHASAAMVKALDAGADDYVTKPFGMAEPLARLRAAVRRSAVWSADSGAASEPWSRPPPSRRTSRPRRSSVTAGKCGSPRPSGECWNCWCATAASSWGSGSFCGRSGAPATAPRPNYLRIYRAQLRRKVESDPAHPRYLITEAGMGYRFEPER